MSQIANIVFTTNQMANSFWSARGFAQAQERAVCAYLAYLTQLQAEIKNGPRMDPHY